MMFGGMTMIVFAMGVRWVEGTLKVYTIALKEKSHIVTHL